jgi:hypothetical protein
MYDIYFYLMIYYYHDNNFHLFLFLYYVYILHFLITRGETPILEKHLGNGVGF